MREVGGLICLWGPAGAVITVTLLQPEMADCDFESESYEGYRRWEVIVVGMEDVESRARFGDINRRSQGSAPVSIRTRLGSWCERTSREEGNDDRMKKK